MSASAPGAEALFGAIDDDPAGVVARASVVLAGTAHDRDAVIAQWARGMARRQLNELSGGEEDLRAARAGAVALGDRQLAARVDVTLALAVLHTATADDALAVLDRAAAHLGGTDLGRLETQRGLILHRVGRLDRAQRAYEQALARYADGGDPVGEIRLRNNQAILLAQRGLLVPSEQAATRGLELAEAHGHRYLTAAALHNRGYVRGRAGRADDAMADLERAEATYLELGYAALVHVARVDLAEVLLGANLLDEAAEVAGRAVDGLQASGNPTDLADAWLLLARCHVALGEVADAITAARQSARLLRRQRRTSLLASATFIRVFAASGRRGNLQPDVLEELSVRLRANGWWLESTVARVLAVDRWVQAGDLDRAERLLRSFERLGSMPAAERSAVAVARATVARARGDLARTRRAITTGLRVVADNQASFADLESRTFSAGHGAALRDLGAELAIEARRPRELLARLEATRAGIVAAPLPSTGDATLNTLLDELRGLASEARAMSAAGQSDERLRTQQLELERRIRDRARRTGWLGAARGGGLGDAITALGDRALLEYAVVRGHVWVVSVVDGKAALHDVGPLDLVEEDLETCAFALLRLNRRGLSSASRAAAWAGLAAAGASMRQRLVPPRIAASDRPIVVVADGGLHGVPWGVVAPAGRTVSVAPSLLGWAAASGAPRRGRRRVAVLNGPDLPGARQEVAEVAALHPSARAAVDATASELVDAFETSDLVHLACHGRFRVDNPMFSTLSMIDGDVNVYDLQQCTRLPHTVVLSACSVGSSVGLQGGNLLGVAAALMSFGVANVVAPLTPVNDEALVVVMTELHRGLAGGASPASALAAIDSGPGSPKAAATAAFVAFGR